MATTLTQAEILMDVIASFKKSFPALNKMGTDFRAESLKLNQQYIAHIAGLPAVATYDANNGGYKNGAQAARGLLTDVPIIVNQHKHVPLKWAHLDNIKDKKNKYEEVIGNAGWVLAKAIMDDILAGAVAANFSNTVVNANANFDLDAVDDLNGKMNINGASPKGRVLLVNTPVAGVLGADQRIASKLFYGQQNGGEAYRHFQNIGGFSDIWEYPDLPANGISLNAFAFESRAIAVLAGIPEQFESTVAQQLGIPQIMGFETVTDPDTGLTMAAVSWQEAGTGDFYWSPTIVWGKSLGKQGGAAGVLTDKAGHLSTSV